MKSIVLLLFVVASLEFVQARGRLTRCDKSAGDCGEKECCIARSLGTAARPGICRPQGFVGDRCSPPGHQLGDEVGNKFVTFCGCREGLECQDRRLYGEISEAKAWNFQCRRKPKPPGGDDEREKPDDVTDDTNKLDKEKDENGKLDKEKDENGKPDKEKDENGKPDKEKDENGKPDKEKDEDGKSDEEKENEGK